MAARLRATVAFEQPDTRDLLRTLAPEVGLEIRSEVDLRVSPMQAEGVDIAFFEQFDNIDAAVPRVYSLCGASPDLLVVVIVPRPREAVDVELLEAGAFDVIDLGPDAKSQLARAVAAARRIAALQSERAQLGADLAHQDKLAAMGVLAAGVGHEVNNPCCVVLASVTAMREELETVMRGPRFHRAEALENYAPLWLESIGDCIGAAKHIASIVKTLNVFSRRAEASPPQMIDLNTEIGTALRMIGKEVRFQANFDLECDPKLPKIVATPNSLTQIVTNLVVNALHALEGTAPAQRHVRIATGFDATHVMLEVADNGPGIPPEIVGRIFDPFFSTKPAGKGTGLGLSITRQLVQKNGGEIFVESEPGQGALFRVLFERRPGIGPEPPKMSSAPPTSARLRVLIVDDDELTLRSIQRSLGAQFECITLTTGSAALASLRQDDKIDVVLSDIVMPEMNGFEFYEALREKHPELGARTVFLTGGITSGTLREQVSRTGQPLMEKPFDTDELVRTIRALGTPLPGAPRPSSRPLSG